MRESGLRGATLRKYVVTTLSDPQAKRREDLVERRFFADAPDRLWVAYITYIPTWSGWLYLAMVLDVYSRKVVGWAMDTNMRTERGGPASSDSFSSDLMKTVLRFRQPALPGWWIRSKPDPGSDRPVPSAAGYGCRR